MCPTTAQLWKCGSVESREWIVSPKRTFLIPPAWHIQPGQPTWVLYLPENPLYNSRHIHIPSLEETMPLKLPRGKQLAVAITADFDAQSLWMETKHITPSFMSRGEFGAEVGIPRLLELFQRYDVKGTFFTPVHTMLTFPRQLEAILKKGHEIAAHGVVHEKVRTLKGNRERKLLEIQVEQHARLVGRRPRGYRSPSWDISNKTLDLLEEFGFEWDSSLMGRDFEPYHPRPVAIDYRNGNKFGLPSPILEFPISWYLDDFPFVEFGWFVGFNFRENVVRALER
jgi:peptidoglycan/xylan/chitin deacetylase (PgdA/CDA1 family)